MGAGRIIYKIKKGLKGMEKLGTIREWQKQDGCWTNIGSPDFGQEQQLRGYLEIQKLGLSNLSDAKKKCLWLLRNCLQKFLRSQDPAGSGFTMRGSENLFRYGGSSGNVSSVRKSEAGEIRLAVRQSILHKAVSFLCWAEMPENVHPGCCQRNAIGLAYDQRAGQAIHGGAAKKSEESKTGSDWNRRDCDTERACLSDSGKRFGARIADLVWGRGSFRGKHGSVLSMVRSKKERKNQTGSYGHVESIRKINTEERSKRGDFVRQVSCYKTFGRGAGQNPEAGIRTAFRRWPQVYKRAKVCSTVQSGESYAGRTSIPENAAKSEQAPQYGILAQRIFWTVMGL